MSAKTGVAPNWLTTEAEAKKVNAGTITSSPGPICLFRGGEVPERVAEVGEDLLVGEDPRVIDPRIDAFSEEEATQCLALLDPDDELMPAVP